MIILLCLDIITNIYIWMKYYGICIIKFFYHNISLFTCIYYILEKNKYCTPTSHQKSQKKPLNYNIILLDT